MTEETFRRIWSFYVIDFVNSGKFPELTKCFYNNDLYFKKAAEEDSYRYFLKCKYATKKLFMEDPSKNLDRHKEGAAIIYAINLIQPLAFDKIIKKSSTIPDEILLCNQLLAINASLGFVASHKLSEQTGVDINLINKISFTLPDSNGQGNYALITGTDLFYSKYYNNYSVLAYANILFLLEKLTQYEYIEQRETTL